MKDLVDNQVIRRVWWRRILVCMLLTAGPTLIFWALRSVLNQEMPSMRKVIIVSQYFQDHYGQRTLVTLAVLSLPFGLSRFWDATMALLWLPIWFLVERYLRQHQSRSVILHCHFGICFLMFAWTAGVLAAHSLLAAYGEQPDLISCYVLSVLLTGIVFGFFSLVNHQAFGRMMAWVFFLLSVMVSGIFQGLAFGLFLLLGFSFCYWLFLELLELYWRSKARFGQKRVKSSLTVHADKGG